MINLSSQLPTVSQMSRIADKASARQISSAAQDLGSKLEAFASSPVSPLSPSFGASAFESFTQAGSAGLGAMQASGFGADFGSSFDAGFSPASFDAGFSPASFDAGFSPASFDAGFSPAASFSPAAPSFSPVSSFSPAAPSFSPVSSFAPAAPVAPRFSPVSSFSGGSSFSPAPVAPTLSRPSAPVSSPTAIAPSTTRAAPPVATRTAPAPVQQPSIFETSDFHPGRGHGRGAKSGGAGKLMLPPPGLF